MPGPNANVQYTFPTTSIDENANDVVVHFDWDSRSMFEHKADGWEHVSAVSAAASAPSSSCARLVTTALRIAP